jgi:hypothetical protein
MQRFVVGQGIIPAVHMDKKWNIFFVAPGVRRQISKYTCQLSCYMTEILRGIQIDH